MIVFFSKGLPQRIWEWAYTVKEQLLGFPKIHHIFFKYNGYPLDLKHPFTHNQRIIHKMLHDRNPLLAVTSDKVKVRDYVRISLGEALAGEILIPQYFVSKTGKDIPNQEWEFEFFLKANHSSGYNKLIAPGTDSKEVRRLSEYWLSQSYGQAYHAWAYRDIPRRIICEKVIRTESGQIPADIKYYCFFGQPKMILILTDRFGDQQRVFTDEQFTVLQGAQMFGSKQIETIPLIPQHSKMMEIASKLAQPFDYCRVDFYAVGDRVHFGEITHYTGAGIEKFDDYDLDLALGNLWQKENAGYSVLEMLQKVKSEKQHEVLA